MNLPFALPTVPPRLRRPLLYVGYTAFAFGIAVMTLYWSLPRDRIKDRLEQALSADPSPSQPIGTGMDVTITDLGLTLFSGPGVHGTDGIFRTRPTDPNVKPTRWLVDDATVHISVFGLMFNRPAYRWVAHALKGEISGKWAWAPDVSRLRIGVDGVVLTGVTAIQSALSGLPVDGTISGKLEIDLPKAMLGDSSGKLDLTADELSVGDGKAKLTVPSDPFLAGGLTVPKIRLGKLEGHITIEHGRARFDDVRLHSADADATIEGFIELHDPISASQLHAYLRFRPSEQLTKREATLELLMNAVQRGKRADGFLGFSIGGSFALPSFQPSTEPPPGVVSKVGGGAPPPVHTVPPPPPPAAPAAPVAAPPLHVPPPGEGTPPAEPAAPPPAPAAAPPALPPPPPIPPPAASTAPEGAEKTNEKDNRLLRLRERPVEEKEKPAEPAEQPKAE